jgi:hypothetical protein
MKNIIRKFNWPIALGATVITLLISNPKFEPEDILGILVGAVIVGLIIPKRNP